MVYWIAIAIVVVCVAVCVFTGLRKDL